MNPGDDVLFEVEGSVVVITMNRPRQRNALNQSLSDGLRESWDKFERAEHLKVAVLTGAGDQAFCAGMDLKEAASRQLGVPPRGFPPVLGDTVHVSKPVIAAVNGAAYAGGWLLAQMCDLCIAADHALFGITEAKVGRGMPWAAPLGRMLPQRVMMELLLTGEPMTAARGYDLGFINAVVPGTELRQRAMHMAETIARNAPLTVRAARELVYLSAEMGRSAGIRAAQHLFESVYRSNDAQEGPSAFAEKRPPRWSGR